MRLFLLALLLGTLYGQNTGAVFQTWKCPRALALVGGRSHSPVYIREGLSRALLEVNIPVTFIENVAMLNAESLKEHQLLIILRDGMNWPDGHDKPPVKWMTPTQRRAIWDFVHNGGGFLALHNSQRVYPEGGL